MGIVTVGISHKTAPLEMRERFSFAKGRLGEYLTELKNSDSVLGAVILSTCNRTEIYVDALEDKSVIQQGINFFMRRYRLSEDIFSRYFYILKDDDAIRHIFKVAAGLDSQIIGETQILEQVKFAWDMAKNNQMMSPMLEQLFKGAIGAGESVRRETKISDANISIADAAIRIAEEHLEDLSNKSVLVIGAGEISKLISRHLKEKKCRSIFVSNRNYVRACELAVDVQAEAVQFSQLNEKLKSADIVFSSTSSPHLILKYAALQEIMRLRQKPLFIIDLALPRDVDPQAKGIFGISLYDLDDLKFMLTDDFLQKQEEIKSAQIIIERRLNAFLDEMRIVL